MHHISSPQVFFCYYKYIITLLMSILRSYTYEWRRQDWQGREMGGSRHVASQARGVFFHYYHDYIYSIYYEKLLNINCIMNGVDREQIETSGVAGAWDRLVSSPFKLPARYVFRISSSKDFLNNCLIDYIHVL